MIMLNTPTYTVEEAAQLLKCHYVTVIRAIRAGKLKAAKLGRDYRISRKELEVFWTSSGGGEWLLKEKTVPVSDEQREALDKLAAEKDTTVSSLVAEAIGKYIKETETKETDKGQDEGRQKLPKRKPKVVL